MRRTLWLGGALMLLAILLVIMLYGRETKVTQISVACRSTERPADTVRWLYTSKIDPSVLPRIAPGIDITLYYTGGSPRAAPPITTYFHRLDGATLRVTSSAKATMPPKSTFTYHVDTGGYVRPLTATGRGGTMEVPIFVEVDGSYFSGLLTPENCAHAPDHHLDLKMATNVPDLKNKHPLNIVASDWIGISDMPTPVVRTEGSQVSTYAYFPAPIALTETKNETRVPDDVAKQAAEVGVVATTPTYALTGEPTPSAGKALDPAKGG
jgi:hypothetical protein